MARCCRTNDFGVSCDSENLICRRGKSGEGKKERERGPNAYLFGPFRFLLLKILLDSFSFDVTGFPRFHIKMIFWEPRRSCGIIASNIAKFRKILIIKCLRTGLRQRHNVSEFIYKTIITRIHWHIYRTRGWPFHRAKAQTLIRKAELITRSLEYYELALQCVSHRLNAANKVSRWY